MNADYAKRNISIPDLLSKLGHQPVQVSKDGKKYKYKSPFRPNEKTASFFATYVGDKWIWNDFGDRGGNIIDLVNRLEGYNDNDIRPALRYLENKFQGALLDRLPDDKESLPTNLFSFKQQSDLDASAFFKDTETTEPYLKFITAHEIRNPIIHTYLWEKRKIPKHLADPYLLEVKYFNTKKGKQFFAIGMKNEGGGYEIRAASDEYSFKSVLNGRDITFISGTSTNKNIVCVFEGMTDFLSFLAMLNVTKLSGDAVIIHSVSTYKKAAEFIKRHPYKRINTFLHDDEAGKECTKKFINIFSESVISYTPYFSPHNDLNDILKAGHGDDFICRILSSLEARGMDLPTDGYSPT